MLFNFISVTVLTNKTRVKSTVCSDSFLSKFHPSFFLLQKIETKILILEIMPETTFFGVFESNIFEKRNFSYNLAN